MKRYLDHGFLRPAALVFGSLALVGVLAAGRVALVFDGDCDLPLRVLHPFNLPAQDDLNEEWSRRTCNGGKTSITDDSLWRTYYFGSDGQLISVRVSSDIPEYCGGRSNDRWFGPRLPLNLIATCH